jgi:hypothetical protein
VSAGAIPVGQGEAKSGTVGLVATRILGAKMGRRVPGFPKPICALGAPCARLKSSRTAGSTGNLRRLAARGKAHAVAAPATEFRPGFSLVPLSSRLFFTDRSLSSRSDGGVFSELGGLGKYK